MTDVVRSFALLFLLSSLQQRWNDAPVPPLKAQNTYVSRGFHGLSLRFFILPQFFMVEMTTAKAEQH